MSEISKVLQNRYEIKSLLGQGGMGAIFEGIDLKLGGSRVAIKQALLTSDSARRAFEREAMLLAKLSHPNLPKIRDYFAEGDDYYFVMEFIEGDDLEQRLARQKHPFAFETVERWLAQLLDVLNYIHGQNPPVTHRDIKPANIKITPFGGIMLIDFGLARDTAAAASMIGYTPAYAPLEQIRGEGTDHRSDIYALGATVYRLLTGEMPVNILQRLESRAMDGTDPQKSLNEVNDKIPQSFAEIIEKAMAFNRATRFQSAAEMLYALDKTAKPNVFSHSTRVEIKSLDIPENTVEIYPATVLQTAFDKLPEQAPTEISKQSSSTVTPESIATIYKPTEFETLEDIAIEEKPAAPVPRPQPNSGKANVNEKISIPPQPGDFNTPLHFETASVNKSKPNNSKVMIGSFAGGVGAIALAVLGFSFWGTPETPQKQITAPATIRKPLTQTAPDTAQPVAAPPVAAAPETSAADIEPKSPEERIEQNVEQKIASEGSNVAQPKSKTILQDQENRRIQSAEPKRNNSIRAETTKPAEKPFFNNKKTTPPGKSSKRLLEEKMRASDDPD